MAKKRKIIISSKSHLDRLIDLIRLLDLSKKWVVEIYEHTKKRSLSQNALMWKWLDIAAETMMEETGHDKEDMHVFFKEHFLPSSAIKHIEIKGKYITKYSTKNLTTKEMSEYLNHIDRWCAQEFGVILPHPEDMQRNY